MLNELALIRNGLAETNPDLLKTIHKSLSEPGKANLLRVVLAPQGSNEIITDLDYLQGDKNTKYWSQGDGNQNQFPAVKLTFPLRRKGAKKYQQWKLKNKTPSPASHLEGLADLRSEYPIDFSGWQSWPKYRNKLEQRAEVYRNGLRGDASTVADLLFIFLQVRENGLALLRELDEKIWRQCEHTADKDILDLAALIMFASLGEIQSLTAKGEIPEGKRPTLLLDFGGGFHTAADKHWLHDISSALFALETQGKQRLGTCALSGENTALIADTFPAQKCNHLGKVSTYSRKKDVPTYLRYGKDAADSMPVSARLADELTSSLRYLNDRDKGTTWDTVPGETGKGDLLLSFCHALPDIPTARLLAYEPASLDDEDDYEREAKEIFNLFRGSDTTLMPQVDFLIIRKVNDGIQKAIFSSSQSLEELESSAENWYSASKNIPDIELLLIKKKKHSFQSPLAISPKQLAWLFKKQYNRVAKSKSTEVPGLPFAEIMALFLNRNSSKEIADRLLNRLLRQYGGLLELAALKQTNPIKHHNYALCAITAIGLLLHKLARLREVYMNELAYKLGQFCAALDEIHIGYCESERNGQLPNRLIGNQAYAAAVNNPVKALEITAQRAAVYEAWAKKMSEKNDKDIGNKKIINAKYALIWLRKHCKELKTLVPQQGEHATAKSKAELLLGYLAGRDSKKTPSKEQQGEHANEN